MDINPLLPIECLFLGGIAALTIAGVLAWRSSERCTRQRRLLIVAARLLGVAALLLIALNPGRWERHLEESTGEWALLLDRSASMAAKDGGEDGQTRWQHAVTLARQSLADPSLAQSAALYTFANTTTRINSDALEKTSPDGAASDITTACRDLLNRYRADGRLLTGILLLSDGRQVPPADAASMTALARTPRNAQRNGRDDAPREPRDPAGACHLAALLESGLAIVTHRPLFQHRMVCPPPRRTRVKTASKPWHRSRQYAQRTRKIRLARGATPPYGAWPIRRY